MILRAFKIYRDTKKGIKDPTGFAFEQARETMLGVILLPVIIYAVIVILLGIMGFTHLIVHASGVAKVFFWIFLVIGIVFGVPAYVFGVIINKLLTHGENMARPHVTRIKTKVEDVVRDIDR